MDSSIKQINTLHPKLREVALTAYNEAVKATPVGVHPVITQGLRTFEESDKLYQLGRDEDGNIVDKSKVVSNAKAGQSWHNYGLALDFTLIVDGKQHWVVDKNWMTVVDIFKSHGFGWGGDWKSFKDNPHFEMQYGHTLKELLAKHEAEDFIEGTTYLNI